MRYTLTIFLLLFFCSVYGQNANLIWAKNMGGATSDAGYSITTDAAGNAYTTGFFTGTADFDPGPGTFNLTSVGADDIFVSKLNSSGNFVWAKRMGGASSDQGSAIALDAFGNVYTTGYFYGSADFDPGIAVNNLSGAGNNIFISKLSSDGSFVWAKNMGSNYNGSGKSIAIDVSGNVYVTGSFYINTSSDPGTGPDNGSPNYDVVIAKLDGAGNFLWTKVIGGALADYSYSLAADNAGNVYTTGSFTGTVDFDPGAATNNLTSGNGGDIFISKLNSSGNFVWAKNMGDSARAYSIAVDASGYVYTTGYFQGTADFDPGVFLSQLAASSTTDKNIFVSKLDPSGNFVWAKNMGGSASDEGRSIKVDAAGNVYTTGSFLGTADFDPNPGNYNLTSVSTGGGDIFISKLDASGNFLWAGKMGGNVSSDQGLGCSITIDNNTNIFATGYFAGTVDFDPNPAIATMTAAGINVFVLKLNQSLPSAPTDYFRSITSGIWNDPATWESSSDNFTWHPASLSPGKNASSITIAASHTVTVTIDVIAARTTINPFGSLLVNQGIHLTVK